jgi:hypothetical protein
MPVARKMRRIVVIGFPLALVGVTVFLSLLGQAGPTLLYWSNLYAPEWLGVGGLPAESWKSLCKPGEIVYSDHAYGFHWTGVAADDGDFMLAVGPEGLAFASASDVTRTWEGWMRSRALIPHSWLLGSAGGLLALALALQYLAIRPHMSPSKQSGHL